MSCDKDKLPVSKATASRILPFASSGVVLNDADDADNTDNADEG